MHLAMALIKLAFLAVLLRAACRRRPAKPIEVTLSRRRVSGDAADRRPADSAGR